MMKNFILIGCIVISELFSTSALPAVNVIKCRTIETLHGNTKNQAVSENEVEFAGNQPKTIILKKLKNLRVEVMNTSGAIGKTKVPQITINLEDEVSGSRYSSIALLSANKPDENGDLNVVLVRKNEDSLGMICVPKGE